MKKIKINRANVTEEMEIDTYVRWLSLMESIYIVSTHGEKIGVNIEKDMNWVKPINFQKYMDDRFVSMKHEVEMELGIFKGGLENPANRLVESKEPELIEEEVEEIDVELPPELAAVISVDVGVNAPIENAL
jgi:hypothetical protein